MITFILVQNIVLKRPLCYCTFAVGITAENVPVKIINACNMLSPTAMQMLNNTSYSVVRKRVEQTIYCAETWLQQDTSFSLPFFVERIHPVHERFYRATEVHLNMTIKQLYSRLYKYKNNLTHQR